MSAEVFSPEAERAHIYELSLTDVSNCTLDAAMNDIFNVFTYSPIWNENSELDISDMIAEAEPNANHGRDMNLFADWFLS